MRFALKSLGVRLKAYFIFGALRAEINDHRGRFSMIIFLKEILIIIIILHEEPTEIPVITKNF